jgi:hypothetical protein
MSGTITVITYSGLCNRLLPITASLRLAKKYNKNIDILWEHTPYRTCIPYEGGQCNFNDLFKLPENVEVVDSIRQNNYCYYDFPYWIKESTYIVDMNSNPNIIVKNSVFTFISTEDNKDSFFRQLVDKLCLSGEIKFDYIGNELSDAIKLLQPVDYLQKEIDHYYKNFSKNTLGVHVRKSDGAFIKYDWNKLWRPLFNKIYEWLASYEDSKIFLTTDDKEVYQIFKDKLDDKLLFYNPPSVLGSVNNTDKFKNDKFNVFCAVIDLHLLGKCQAIIGTATSTFSLCGMLLADKNIKKYMIDNSYNLDEIVY